MSTVDIGEARRRLERYLVDHATRPLGDAASDHIPATLVLDVERRWRAADALLAYLPLVLDEVEQLRAEVAGKS